MTEVKVNEEIQPTIKQEKIQLISSILTAYFLADPERTDDWHVQKFDYLYDRSLLELKALDALFKSSK